MVNLTMHHLPLFALGLTDLFTVPTRGVEISDKVITKLSDLSQFVIAGTSFFSADHNVISVRPKIYFPFFFTCQ